VPQDVSRFFLSLCTLEWQQIAQYLGYTQHFLDSLLVNHMSSGSNQDHVSVGSGEKDEQGMGGTRPGQDRREIMMGLDKIVIGWD